LACSHSKKKKQVGSGGFAQKKNSTGAVYAERNMALGEETKNRFKLWLGEKGEAGGVRETRNRKVDPDPQGG